jgi:hypothetical protein
VIPIELICKIPASNPVMRALNWLLRVLTWMAPSLFGYQIMFIARPVRPATAAAPVLSVEVA